MPIYQLKCALRFKTGHAGVAFDTVEIGAPDPAAAIALAELYRCSTPGMDLSVAVLTDAAGRLIWTRRLPDRRNPGLDRVPAKDGLYEAVSEGLRDV